jgi:mannosyltransferase OCH1-like enzyme
MIPNIIHFVFGLKPQDEEFLFVYYVSVYSAFIINNPEKIFLYYDYEPYGKWWEELKMIPSLHLQQIDSPTHFGNKLISKTAHKADKVRMDILFNKGGIYLDIDTICVKPFADLLNKKVVLGIESPNAICNAIMMTEAQSDFFKIWLERYEEAFIPYGWAEASILLPSIIAKETPELLTLLEPEYFFLPSWNETEKIFVNKYEIPENLIALHLWETMSIKNIKDISGWEWAYVNPDTLYGKLLQNIISNDKVIYMTYKKKIPKYVYSNWKKTNEKYRIDFSLDSDCLYFLKECFNDYIVNMFKNIREGKHKADLWRLCKLYIYGGVYSDVDLIPHFDISSINKDLTFASCLSIQSNSIFQAFMYVSKPKSPLVLCFLISLLKYNGKLYGNLPCDDMYKCVSYNISDTIIEPEKKYDIFQVKILIYIGPSETNTKIVNIGFFPENVSYEIKLCQNIYKDEFLFSIKENCLEIRRLDEQIGWGHTHSCNIIIKSNEHLTFFKEQYEGDWKKAYVTSDNKKIFDSHDPEYINDYANYNLTET